MNKIKEKKGKGVPRKVPFTDLDIRVNYLFQASTLMALNGQECELGLESNCLNDILSRSYAQNIEIIANKSHLIKLYVK